MSIPEMISRELVLIAIRSNKLGCLISKCIMRSKLDGTHTPVPRMIHNCHMRLWKHAAVVLLTKSPKRTQQESSTRELCRPVVTLFTNSNLQEIFSLLHRTSTGIVANSKQRKYGNLDVWVTPLKTWICSISYTRRGLNKAYRNFAIHMHILLIFYHREIYRPEA